MPILIPKQDFRPQEFFRMLLRQELSMVSPEFNLRAVVKAAFCDVIRRLQGFPGIIAARVDWFSSHGHGAKTAFACGGFFIIIFLTFLPKRALINRPHEKT